MELILIIVQCYHDHDHLCSSAVYQLVTSSRHCFYPWQHDTASWTQCWGEDEACHVPSHQTQDYNSEISKQFLKLENHVLKLVNLFPFPVNPIS